jgi:hypothetical protein
MGNDANKALKSTKSTNLRAKIRPIISTFQLAKLVSIIRYAILYPNDEEVEYTESLEVVSPWDIMCAFLLSNSLLSALAPAWERIFRSMFTNTHFNCIHSVASYYSDDNEEAFHASRVEEAYITILDLIDKISENDCENVIEMIKNMEFDFDLFDFR